MKTEIAASKFLHRLAAGGVIVNKLCLVITLIVAYSSPSWASENARSKHDRRHFTTTARQWTWANAQARLPQRRVIDPYWTPCDNSSSSYADRCD
jgi:hypothetical protein